MNVREFSIPLKLVNPARISQNEVSEVKNRAGSKRETHLASRIAVRRTVKQYSTNMVLAQKRGKTSGVALVTGWTSGEKWTRGEEESGVLSSSLRVPLVFIHFEEDARTMGYPAYNSREVTG